MKIEDLLKPVAVSPKIQQALRGSKNLELSMQKYLQKHSIPIQNTLLSLSKAIIPCVDILNLCLEFIKKNEESLREFSNLAKNLNGLSISFLVQSQFITKESSKPSRNIKTYGINNLNKTKSETPVQIDKYATASDIQEINARISNLESVQIEQTRQEYKLEIKQQNCQEKLLWLTMSGNKLIMNDTIIHHTFKTNSNDIPSINSRLINHLILNPCTEFSRDDLIKKRVLNKNEDKDFNICLQDMKFVDNFAKLFFKTTKDTIELTNPITLETKNKKGMEFIELPKISKKKK